jgi:2-iminobutanoate/2-iminopropanoate deaminase
MNISNILFVEKMIKKVLKIKDIHDTWGIYSHAILANGFLFISGQVALDKEQKVVGKGDIETQTEQVMKNIDTILRTASATFNDIIKIRIHLTNLDDRVGFHKVRKKYFKENLPASTLVIVESLIDKDLLVEVESIAAID